MALPLTLPSPDQPIQNPWFTVVEVLILLIAPAMVVFTVGLHSWALADRKSLSLLSVIFMSMCAIVTCCVHFAVLTLSRELIFTKGSWSRLVFAFQWPSVSTRDDASEALCQLETGDLVSTMPDLGA